MTTRVKLGGAEAWWKDGQWASDNEVLEEILNRVNEPGVLLGGANPWPVGVAVELAQKRFPDLEILDMDPKPEFDKDVIY